MPNRRSSIAAGTSTDPICVVDSDDDEVDNLLGAGSANAPAVAPAPAPAPAPAAIPPATPSSSRTPAPTASTPLQRFLAQSAKAVARQSPRNSNSNSIPKTAQGAQGSAASQSPLKTQTPTRPTWRTEPGPVTPVTPVKGEPSSQGRAPISPKGLSTASIATAPVTPTATRPGVILETSATLPTPSLAAAVVPSSAPDLAAVEGLPVPQPASPAPPPAVPSSGPDSVETPQTPKTPKTPKTPTTHRGPAPAKQVTPPSASAPPQPVEQVAPTVPVSPIMPSAPPAQTAPTARPTSVSVAESVPVAKMGPVATPASLPSSVGQKTSRPPPASPPAHTLVATTVAEIVPATTSVPAPVSVSVKAPMQIDPPAAEPVSTPAPVPAPVASPAPPAPASVPRSASVPASVVASSVVASTGRPSPVPPIATPAQPAKSARTTPKPTTAALRHPFQPPLEPTGPLTRDDMQREAHRRIFPGALRCPLAFASKRGDAPEQCTSTLATGQILDIHLKKHIEKLRSPEGWPMRVVWIDAEGVEVQSFKQPSGVEKYMQLGRENMELTRCIFDGCDMEFKMGQGRSAHYKNQHPPPYAYDQLRPLNVILRTPYVPRPLPTLPDGPISYIDIVTPRVRAAPRGTPLPTGIDKDRKVYAIAPVETDDPFQSASGARLDYTSSDFLHVPTVMLASGEVQTDEPPHSQVPQPSASARGSRRSRRGSPLPTGGGPLGVSFRVPDSPCPEPSANAAGRTEMRFRPAPSIIVLRNTGPDVILENIRKLSAAAEAKKKAAAVAKKAAEGKEKGEGEGEGGDAAEKPAAIVPLAALKMTAPAAPVAPATPPPTVLGKRLRSRPHKDARLDQAARAEREKKMERTARKYAFRKTGQWVGFEFYAHYRAGVEYLENKEVAAAKAKAEVEVKAREEAEVKETVDELPPHKVPRLNL